LTFDRLSGARSTVQRYVEALGGELRITAVFDDEEMALLSRP
jgi:hypothetical protein